MNPRERFWPYVAITDDEISCWLWTGSTDKMGYGRLRLLNQTLAHRVSWFLTYGTIPDGLCVLHRCDNPPCVRPKHLFLGTRAENNADRDAKGRQPRGDAHGTRIHPEKVRRGDNHYSRTKPDLLARGTVRGQAKLTEQAVVEIRQLYATDTWTYEALGHQFGVSKVNILKIVRRLTWKHVP